MRSLNDYNLKTPHIIAPLVYGVTTFIFVFMWLFMQPSIPGSILIRIVTILAFPAFVAHFVVCLFLVFTHHQMRSFYVYEALGGFIGFMVAGTIFALDLLPISPTIAFWVLLPISTIIFSYLFLMVGIAIKRLPKQVSKNIEKGLVILVVLVSFIAIFTIILSGDWFEEKKPYAYEGAFSKMYLAPISPDEDNTANFKALLSALRTNYSDETRIDDLSSYHSSYIVREIYIMGSFEKSDNSSTSSTIYFMSNHTIFIESAKEHRFKRGYYTTPEEAKNDNKKNFEEDRNVTVELNNKILGIIKTIYHTNVTAESDEYLIYGPPNFY